MIKHSADAKNRVRRIASQHVDDLNLDELRDLELVCRWIDQLEQDLQVLRTHNAMQCDMGVVDVPHGTSEKGS